MKRAISHGWLWMLAAVGLFAAGCQAGGQGDPCTPEDEYLPDFSGFQSTEVNVESRSFQCETRVCLVNHFQGRVSCQYGQSQDTADTPVDQLPATDASRCRLPGSKDIVTVAVDGQWVNRRADDAVYCSCRCDGPDKNARYCECAQGFQCTQLVDDIGLGRGQLAGSYCVRKGTKYDATDAKLNGACELTQNNCGDPVNMQ